MNNLFNSYNAKNKPLLLDGAMGSIFQQKGFVKDKHLWYSHLNIFEPKAVCDLHKEYISTGADIITTNTFRTNPVAKKKSNINISNNELVKRSVQIAIEAKENKAVVIAGSNAPSEDCYQKERTLNKFDLEYNHKKHIEMLFEAGCDIIWNETQSHLDEIEIISRFCSENKIPFSMNLFFDESSNILSGEPLVGVIELVQSYSPQTIGFNCIKPSTLQNYLEKYSTPDNFGFYFNCGLSNVEDESFSSCLTEAEYKQEAKDFLKYKPAFVGACCGSNTKHISALKELLDETN